MADRGIIFSAPMVRALLDGRKTQTRRLLKGVPEGARYSGIHYASDEPDSWFFNSPRGPRKLRVSFEPGDRLYVREAWRMPTAFDPFSPMEAHSKVDPFFGPNVFYEVDGAVRAAGAAKGTPGRYRHARFMPRWASRLTLTVTDVRVQRVAEIGSDDAISEGVERHGIARGWKNYRDDRLWCGAPETSFESLWNSLHTKPGERWEDNPFVVAVSFSVEHRNIDR